MKNLLASLLLLSSAGTFADEFSCVTGSVSMSSCMSAWGSLMGGVGVSHSSNVTTYATLVGTERSVAWREQAADERAVLVLDISLGDVTEVAQVRGPVLRELFTAALADDAVMAELRTAFPGHSDLEMLVAALEVSLF